MTKFSKFPKFYLKKTLLDRSKWPRAGYVVSGFDSEAQKLSKRTSPNEVSTCQTIHRTVRSATGSLTGRCCSVLSEHGETKKEHPFLKPHLLTKNRWQADQQKNLQPGRAAHPARWPIWTEQKCAKKEFLVHLSKRPGLCLRPFRHSTRTVPGCLLENHILALDQPLLAVLTNRSKAPGCFIGSISLCSKALYKVFSTNSISYESYEWYHCLFLQLESVKRGALSDDPRNFWALELSNQTVLV